jgi:hypothetical protein
VKKQYFFPDYFSPQQDFNKILFDAIRKKKTFQFRGNLKEKMNPTTGF